MLSVYLDIRITAQLQKKLDRDNYNESELISIKVPAQHLSYFNSSKKFERVEGQIELNGLRYNFVKRRLFNDSIEMLCIPNRGVMQLLKTNNDYFNLVNDLQRPGQEKRTDAHSLKSFSGDYCTIHELSCLKCPYDFIRKAYFYINIKLPRPLPHTTGHPPEMIA